MNHSVLLRPVLAMGAAALVSAASPPVEAAALIAAGLPVAGVSQTQLATQFTQWWLSELSGTDADQAFLNTRNPSPVTFLPVTGMPTVTYNLTILAGVPVFFPIVVGTNWWDDDQSTDGPPCDTAPDRFACHQVQLAAFMDNPSALTLRVNGLAIPISDSQRLNSSGLAFDVTIGPGNPFGAVPGNFKSLFDGWWAALSPFSTGQHVVEYGFDYEGAGVMQTAMLNVVPTGSSLSLAALGFLLLVAQRKRG